MAVSTAFLLIAGTLSHTVVASLMLFAALHAGAPFGYADWLGVAGVVTAGNLVGGLGLVTLAAAGAGRTAAHRRGAAGRNDVT